MKLRIATYNIHKGVSAFGRKARIHGIKDAIDLLDADLVFLQEVQGQHDLHAENHTLWPQEGQHDFLAGQSHQAVYGMNAVYEHGHHGNALLSRYPIASFANHDVSDHAYEQRGILHAVVRVEEVDVHCFVIHLGLFAASRRRQIQALIQTIKRDLPAQAPLVIAGDFNDWSQRLSQTLYQELGVFEAFDVDAHHGMPRFSLRNMRNLFAKNKGRHARTFPAGLPWLCLDRVYLRGFKVNEAEVLKGAPWTTLSDHVPIMVSLELSTPAEAA
ncbi:endonuclease/exonuclease/phosphatase family protein [Undibacterium sp. Ji50W]|uniref:endonuclease/exonuclease/phosphatase family protein n=1 Tax=Undibacterium sp. Ji50W TaxID=3413041 RepID=UPI003BF01E7F